MSMPILRFDERLEADLNGVLHFPPLAKVPTCVIAVATPEAGGQD